MSKPMFKKLAGHTHDFIAGMKKCHSDALGKAQMDHEKNFHEAAISECDEAMAVHKSFMDECEKADATDDLSKSFDARLDEIIDKLGERRLPMIGTTLAPPRVVPRNGQPTPGVPAKAENPLSKLFSVEG